MPLSVKIASDFVCPYCFALEALLRRLRLEGMELSIEHLPFELTEPTEPPVEVCGDPEPKLRYERDLAPLCREVGLTMHMPPGVSPRPYTRSAFQGLYLARELGREDDYVHRIFQGYFEEERDIADVETLFALAEEAGIPSQAFREALGDGRYASLEREAVRHAKEELEVRIVPTLFLGDRRLEGGAKSLHELKAWLLGQDRK